MANRRLRRLTKMAALKREEKIAKSLREKSLWELQQQLTTLNADYGALALGGASFDLFPMLPAEIRLCVWEHAVAKTRLVRIELRERGHNHGNDSEPPAYSVTNSLGNIISSGNYDTEARGVDIKSPLFQVNHEARQVALRFYRVRIPCLKVGPPAPPSDPWTRFLLPSQSVPPAPADIRYVVFSIRNMMSCSCAGMIGIAPRHKARWISCTISERVIQKGSEFST